MRISSFGRLRPNVALGAALAAWAMFALLFAFLPSGQNVAAGVFNLATGALAGLAIVNVLQRPDTDASEEGRLFWVLFGLGLALRLSGDMAWVLYQAAGRVASGPAPQDLMYATSYVVLSASLLLLLTRTLARGVSPVAALDAVAVVLSVGTLVWLFVLGPAGEAVRGGRDAVVALSLPACDAALLYLGLVALSADRKPSFVNLLVPGLLAFFVADLLYLASRQDGPYAPGGWPEPIWTLGFVFFGLAALRAGGSLVGVSEVESRLLEDPEVRRAVRPWRVFAFWFGPLSPPLQFAAIMLWGFLGGRLPGYVFAAGAVLMVYLALRVSVVSLVSRRLAEEGEDMARRLENARVLRELHGAVKQGVHGVSLALKSAVEVEKRGDEHATRAALRVAQQVARQAEYQVSRPYDELEALPVGGLGQGSRGPGEYLRHRLKKFEEYFAIETHEDLRVPLEELSEAEMAAVYRVVVEAFWNVAKHSGARNMRLESRRVGSVIVVRVRDDGHGFDAKDPPPGLGLVYMRRRAAEVGAGLDVISAPDGSVGTTVQLRFGGK